MRKIILIKSLLIFLISSISIVNAIEETCPLPPWTVCEKGECISLPFEWVGGKGKKVGWTMGPLFETDPGQHEYYIRIHMDESLLHWYTVTSKTNFTGNYEIKVLCTSEPLKFDFGTPTSPVGTGYVGVNDTTLYPTVLWGWDDITNLESEDNGYPDNVKGDFVKSTSDHTFIVDITPNGNYRVSLTFCDEGVTHDKIDVYAEGILKIDDFTYDGGGWPTISFDVEVTDEQLNIKFHDDGGSNPYWIINAISIQSIDPCPYIESMASSLDFNISHYGPSYVFEPSYVYGEDAFYNDCGIMWLNFTQSASVYIETWIEYKTYITDLNRDDKIDIYDAIILSNEYGNSWGSPGDPVNPDDYTWRADINSDGVVGISDADIFKNQFGTNYIASKHENSGLLNIWEADWEYS